jgi:transcriptional repressor NrdR
MICPYCNNEETKVTDKRDIEGETKRRRECLKCNERFTTYERVEVDLNVVKKDGRREKFSREKLRRGVEKAFEKRPFTSEQIQDIITEIESKIFKSSKDKEIKSSQIGEIVMNKIKKYDKIAYIRFASVYREFADLEDFKKEIKELK